MLYKSYIRFFRKQYKFKYYIVLIKFYKKYSCLTYTTNMRPYTVSLGILQSNKQLISSMYYPLVTNYSAGFILKKMLIELKRYKRTVAANTNIVLYLQKLFFAENKYIEFFFMRNYNLRLWSFLQKLWLLISPVIFFLLYSRSYNIVRKPTKRIKRRVLRIIQKQ